MINIEMAGCVGQLFFTCRSVTMVGATVLTFVFILLGEPKDLASDELDYVFDGILSRRSRPISGYSTIEIFKGEDFDGEKIGDIEILFDQRTDGYRVSQRVPADFPGNAIGTVVQFRGTTYWWPDEPGWKVVVDDRMPTGPGSYFDIKNIGLCNYFEAFYGLTARECLSNIREKARNVRILQTELGTLVKADIVNGELKFKLELTIDEIRGFAPQMLDVSSGHGGYNIQVSYEQYNEYWLPSSAIFRSTINNNTSSRSMKISWSHVGEFISEDNFDIQKLTSRIPVQLIDNRGHDAVVAGMLNLSLDEIRELKILMPRAWVDSLFFLLGFILIGLTIFRIFRTDGNRVLGES